MKRLAYAEDGTYLGIDAHLGRAPQSTGEIDPDDFNKDELVALAEERGLAVTGTKQELADRLNSGE